jgi:hypothetical protein
MKIIKTFIKIVHTRYIYFISREKKKTSRDILRVVLGLTQMLAVLNSYFYHQHLNKINKYGNQNLGIGILTNILREF